MSMCLTDERLQAVADDEADTDAVDHVSGCRSCAARVRELQSSMDDFRREMAGLTMPTRLAARVAAVVSPPPITRTGATTLRAPATFPARRAWVFAGGIGAAAVLLLVFVLFPAVDRGTRLNAAEILNRSLATLNRQGFEALHYDLTIEAPRGLPVETGTYRIQQVINHDTGRWKIARFAVDGMLLNGISEDPAARTREVFLREGARTYRFRFALSEADSVPLWSLQRRFAESMIRLVQVAAGHVVSEVGTGDERQFIVELSDTGADSTALFDLRRARFVINASDFHIVQFATAGSVMGEHVSIAYRLEQRVVGAAVTPESIFALPPSGPDTIELEGPATLDPMRDMFSRLLHEVARGRR